MPDAVKLEAEEAKLRAEEAKLRAEEAKLRLEIQHQGQWGAWGMRTLLPTVVAALTAGLASHWFSDSLLERSRAEIRRDVLKTYFSVENSGAGKRKQILGFVETMANDDPVLAAWVIQERPNVDTAVSEAAQQTQAHESQMAILHSKQAKIEAARDNALAELQRADIAESWLVDARPSQTLTIEAWLVEVSIVEVSIPGTLGKFLGAGLQRQLLDLFQATEAPTLPDFYECETFYDKRNTLRNPPVPASDDDYEAEAVTRNEALDAADACRKILIEWVAQTAAKTNSDLHQQLQHAIESHEKSRGRSIASTDVPTSELQG